MGVPKNPSRIPRSQRKKVKIKKTKTGIKIIRKEKIPKFLQKIKIEKRRGTNLINIRRRRKTKKKTRERKRTRVGIRTVVKRTKAKTKAKTKRKKKDKAKKR